MARQYRKFDQDFRVGRVRLVWETDKPIAQVARELGINEGTLGSWCARERRRRDDGNAALSESERAELERLRKGARRNRVGFRARRIYRCGMASEGQPDESVARRYAVLRPYLDERQRRLLLGAEAAELGRGGIKAVALATGVHPDTVAKGVRELEGGVEP